MNRIDRQPPEIREVSKVVAGLRVCLSRIMAAVSEYRLKCRSEFRYPPNELQPIMIGAQQLMSEMLGHSEVYSGYADIEPILNHLILVEKTFENAEKYFRELVELKLPHFSIDEKLLEDALLLLSDYFSRRH